MGDERLDAHRLLTKQCDACWLLLFKLQLLMGSAQLLYERRGGTCFTSMVADAKGNFDGLQLHWFVAF